MGKKILGLMLGCLLPALPAQAEEFPFLPQYPFETAVIDYEGTGILGGKATLYVDAEGKRQAFRENKRFTVMGMEQKENTLRIRRPDGVYTINMDTKTGWRSESPSEALRKDWEQLSEVEKKNVEVNARQFGFNLAAGMGGKLTPRGGSVLGRSCDKAEVMGTVTCTWSKTDIMLSTEVDLGIPGTQKAVAIKEDTQLPEGIFDIPKGVTITEAPDGDIGVKAARNMLQAMTKPDFNGNLEALMPAAGPSNVAMPKQMKEGAQQMNVNEMLEHAGKAMQQLQQMGGGR